MAGSDGVPGVSGRVYRALLLVYPREFRDAYGDEMARIFRDLCREKWRENGVMGLAGLWFRTLRDLAATALVERMAEREVTRRREVDMSARRLVWTGLVLLSAPLFFVTASLLKYELGVGLLFDPLEAFLSGPGMRHMFNLISPVVFLGGLGLALVLNAHAVVRLSVCREDGTIVGTVRLEARFWNISVIAVSLLLLATLVGYFFAENFAYCP